MKSSIEFISSKVEGPTVAIIAAIHGNEPCGLSVLDYFYNSNPLLRGSVYLIIGNPEALEKKVRFVDSNLNRLFFRDSELPPHVKEGVESKRMKEIREVLDKCDALIDLHTSGTKNSVPFVIYQKRYEQIAKKIPVSIRTFGWTEIEPGGTDYYMDVHNKPGFCVECGYHDDVTAPIIALDSTLAFLSYFQMIEDISIPVVSQVDYELVSLYKTTTNFIPTQNYKDFQSVSSKEIIGIDGTRDVEVFEQANTVLFVRKRDGKNEEAFLSLKKL